jgi:hypothetical protein
MLMMIDTGIAAGTDKEKEKTLNDVLEKHGIKDDGKPGASPQFPEIKDKVGLLADLSAWFEKNFPEKKLKIVEIAEADLSNFTTKDDTATADVSMGGKKESKPLDFKKIDGKWYVDFGGIPGRNSKAGPAEFPKAK